MSKATESLDDVLFDRAPLSHDIPKETFRYEPTPFTPNKTVARVSKHSCQCGNEWRLFEGYFKGRELVVSNAASSIIYSRVKRTPNTTIDRTETEYHSHDECILCFDQTLTVTPASEPATRRDRENLEFEHQELS